MYRQDAPNSVQLEPTEGCNLRCTFCGINGIRGANVRSTDNYMTLATAEAIAKSIAEAGWNPRLEFAMRGEPTLNPDLAGIFRIFRQHLPKQQIMLTTNGVPLQKSIYGLPSAVDKLFEAGMNIIALDNYHGLKVAPELRAYALSRGYPLYEYPEQPEGNHHTRRPLGTRMVTIVADISQAHNGVNARLSNHCGAAGPLDYSMKGKRCTLPFREMSIRWNGDVALCCEDWRGKFKVGNVVELGVEGVWHQPSIYAARKFLLRGQRIFAPCRGCTNMSYRVGLLPDRSGRETYPEPTQDDVDAILAATSGDTYTPAIERPWERKLLPVLPS